MTPTPCPICKYPGGFHWEAVHRLMSYRVLAKLWKPKDWQLPPKG